MNLHFDCRHEYAGGFALEAAFDAGDGVTELRGASGSGKTTILLLVAGLLRPQRGRIVLGERVLVDTSQRKWTPPHERAVGVVFQDALLFPHHSVRSNLEYGQRRRPAKRFAFDRVVEALELGELLPRYPATLSGGQARRVAIGRALLRGPELLVLDEPWSGLDESLVKQILGLVERCLAEWRIPTLLVSHDDRFTLPRTNHVVEIAEGRVQSVRAEPAAEA